MPKGLIIIDGILLLIGIIVSVVLWNQLRILPFMVIGVLTALVNMAIGATNTPENVDSKFRRFLFGK